MLQNQLNVVVLTPAYNEGASIANIILEAQNYVDEIIVCDDGSIDNTAKIAEKMGATLIQHKKNRGKGYAMKSLLKAAIQCNVDIAVFIDADGQHIPGQIPRLIEPIINGEADMVIGSWFLKGSKMDIPPYRRLGLGIIDRFFGAHKKSHNLSDSQSGFRAISKNLFEAMSRLERMGFGVKTEQISYAINNGCRIIEVPIDVLYTGIKKTSSKNPLSHGVEILSTISKIIVQEKPFIFIGVPGIFLFAIGFLSTGALFYYYNASRYFSIPLALISLGAFLLGVISILGFLIFYNFNRILLNLDKNK